MDILEALTRRVAKHTTHGGEPALQTDGDPLVVEAFRVLGWADPYVESAVVEPAPVIEMPQVVEPEAPASKPKKVLPKATPAPKKRGR